MTKSGPTFAHVPASEGDARWHLGALTTIRLDGSDTGGALAIVETFGPRGMGSPPHVHALEDETFLVLEGEVAFHHGDTRIAAGPGDIVHLPRNEPHWFTVESEHARFLNVISPAGFEDFFRQLSEPAPARELPPPLEGPPDVERIRRVAGEFGCTILA